MNKKLLVGAMSLGLLFTGSLVTFAGTAWEDNISVYVPNYNGNAKTQPQIKATSGAQAGLELHATQGIELDVRTQGNGGNAEWKRNVKGGNTYSLNSLTTSGGQENLQFSSKLFESQNVIAILDWRSN